MGLPDRALTFNLGTPQTNGIPFTAQDFMDWAERESRVAETKAQQEIDSMRVMAEKARIGRLMAFKGGKAPPGFEWAEKRKRGG